MAKMKGSSRLLHNTHSLTLFMPRPQRIEYKNAFYHVMNRGRARQAIIQDESYYQTFLDTLAEVHQRFHCVIHAYYLMQNSLN